MTTGTYSFRQRFFIAVAALCFGLGLIGVFVPLLPTTPFMLAAVALASRGSPLFAVWIRNQRYAGPAIRNWEQERAISLHAKLLALGTLAISAAIIYKTIDSRSIALAIIAGLIGVALYLARRPRPSR